MRDSQSASRIFSQTVGDAKTSLKCGGRLARALEEQFILDGWPVGQMYGCESELARRYDVGRAIVRETARILEARGTACMRRGKRGGLLLTAPSADRLHDMIGGYCYLIGVSPEHIRSSQLVLDRVAAYMASERMAHMDFAPLLNREAVERPTVGRNLRRFLTAAAGNSVITSYMDCLDSLRASHLLDRRAEGFSTRRAGSLAKCIDRLVVAVSRGDKYAAAAWARACSERVVDSPDPGTDPGARTRAAVRRPELRAPEGLYRTRAGQIVHRLIKDVQPGQWTDGFMLGNQMQLCERYQVDRGVLRQAIRILEASETAVSVTGRGHGLMARAPGPASLSRLICCHFAANRVGYYQALQAFKWLSVEVVALAAHQDKAKNLESVVSMLTALRERTDAVRLSDLIAIEEQQFALVANPLLELFLRSAKAFPCWAMQTNRPVPHRIRSFTQSREH